MFGVPASNLYGSGVVGRLLERDRLDHVAAALIRRHRLEQLRLAVQHADAGRAVQLVAREHVEVAVERLHVDGQVRRRLGAVDQHRHAAACASRDHLLHGIDRARARSTDVTIATSFVCAARAAARTRRAAARRRR